MNTHERARSIIIIVLLLINTIGAGYIAINEAQQTNLAKARTELIAIQTDIINVQELYKDDPHRLMLYTAERNADITRITKMLGLEEPYRVVYYTEAEFEEAQKYNQEN